MYFSFSWRIIFQSELTYYVGFYFLLISLPFPSVCLSQSHVFMNELTFHLLGAVFSGILGSVITLAPVFL